MIKEIGLPYLDESILRDLRVGDQVCLSGIMYTARDATHRRILEDLDQGKELPFPLVGQALYYMGPSPARPGQVIGAAGPTTSSRMDASSPRLMELGLRLMIGKGARSSFIVETMQHYGAVYLAAIGGAGALLSKRVLKAEVVAYPELGPEAVLRIQVQGFPAVVVNDSFGQDLYRLGRERYCKKF